MKALLILAISLCAVFTMCHSKAIEENYEALLASIHNIPLAENDGTPIVVSYEDGVKRIYTRGIFEDIFDTIVDTTKDVATSLGFKFSYKTPDGTEVVEKRVIMKTGEEKADVDADGRFGYGVGNKVIGTMWISGNNGFKAKVVFKTRGAIGPKALESLLSG